MECARSGSRRVFVAMFSSLRMCIFHVSGGAPVASRPFVHDSVTYHFIAVYLRLAYHDALFVFVE